MDIYIKWDNDKKSIQLPILPESFEISDRMNNTTINIHNLGDINLKGKRGLYEIGIRSFFPSQQYSFSRTGYNEPYEFYIKKLKECFENNTTMHLIITETDINGYFTIESFSYGHGDKTKDISYSISLKEYREINSRVNKGATTTTHKWKKGDTWQKVTKKYLGSSKKWKTVRKNNNAVIKKAKKKNPKKKEKVALIGYKVVIKP